MRVVVGVIIVRRVLVVVVIIGVLVGDEALLVG